MYATIIAGDGTFLQMDVTTDWGRSLAGTPTNNPVESGATIADHYYTEPETFTLNGSVSFIKTGVELNELDPKDWDSKIRALIQSRQPFTVSLDDKFTPPIPNCLITNYSISRSTNLDSLGISLSFQQIIIAARAREVAINVVAGVNGNGDLTGAGKDAGAASGKKATPSRTATPLASIDADVGGLTEQGRLIQQRRAEGLEVNDDPIYGYVKETGQDLVGAGE